jgi:putative transposase
MRQPRQLYDGARYHVTARANRQEFIFNSKKVKRIFIALLKRAKRKYGFRLHNFSIMGNHVHLLIEPGKEHNLSKIMQWLLSCFAQIFNRIFKKKGHVWYDRFRSSIVNTLKYFRNVFDYISQNPVKAKLVQSPEEYKFSGLYFIKMKKYEVVDFPIEALRSTNPELF